MMLQYITAAAKFEAARAAVRAVASPQRLRDAAELVRAGTVVMARTGARIANTIDLAAKRLDRMPVPRE